MKKQVLLCVILSSLTVMWFSSCDTTPTSGDPAAAKEKSTQAYSEMENLFTAPGSIQDKDFTAVEKLYKDAVAADPNNPTANFGAAFTHILATFADTAIKNAVNRWEDSPVNPSRSLLNFGIPTGTKEMSIPTKVLGTNLVKIIRTATSDPPTITEMQNLLRDRLLPRIDYALARLAVVEQHPDFELRISGKMQGDAGKKDVYLDLTEVYVMDAMIQGMKALVEQFLVFKFELSDYTTKSIVAALQQNNPNFFVLASDGNAHAHNVYSSLINAVGKIRSGVNFLRSETDDQNDDIIKRGSGGIAVQDLDTVLTYLDKIETALTGTFGVELKDGDSDNNDYTIQISLNNFFNNLPQNPKQAWLPTYTVDSTSHGDLHWKWQAQDYASLTFPDPTFSGLFPGMTNETLKRILYIDEAFAWRVSVELYDGNNILNNASVVIVVNGKTYEPKPDGYYWSGNYRYFEFYIMDNNTMPVQQITATINGQQFLLQFFGNSPVVKPKGYDYIEADVTTASQNVTAEYFSNSIQVNLQNWGYYKIEKAVGTGSYAVVDTIQSSYYSDYNVSGGATYKYRALRVANYYYLDWYNDYYYAYRSNNYTNTASVTTP